MPDEPTQNATVDPTPVHELRALVEQAQAGDVDALPRLRDILDHSPELWCHFGNLAGHVEEAWLRLLAGADLCIKESMARTATAMRAELVGENPSLMERLLVDAVISTWLEAQYYAAVLAATGETGSPRQAESLQQRRDAAHRRHLAAIKILAEVRNLLSSVARSRTRSPKPRRRPADSAEPVAEKASSAIRPARVAEIQAQPGNVLSGERPFPSTIPMADRTLDSNWPHGESRRSGQS